MDTTELVDATDLSRQARQINGRIQELLTAAPHLQERYRQARTIIRAFRRPSFYEISQKCNLWCEGCYYFEDGARQAVRTEMVDAEWDAFFAAENARGVSMAYLVGAEPSLYPRRLRAASRNIRYGKIGTNGTIALSDDIEFRIGVSVWGNETDDALLRGGAVLRKALRNYAGDPRALLVYTLSPWNVDSLGDVLKAAEDHDLKLTFSMYSPTTSYLSKLDAGTEADSKYFRLGPSMPPVIFSDDDLLRVRDAMGRAMQSHPGTVLFCDEYADLVTTPGPLFEMDPETGLPLDCGSRIREPLRYFDGAGTSKQVKCCTPDVDCNHCRLYSGTWARLLRPTAQHLTDSTAFDGWLRMIDTIGHIFLYPYPFADSTEAATIN